MNHEQIIENYRQFRGNRILSLEPWKPNFKVVAKGFPADINNLLIQKAEATLHLSVLEVQGETGNTRNYENTGFQDVDQMVRQFFLRFTPDCLPRKTIAENYYRFYDLCRETDISLLIIAGACTYYYWGVHPLYDIDVVVPSIKEMEILAQKTEGQINRNSASKIGVMNYLNLGDVDVLSDINLISDKGEIEKQRLFSFAELFEDSWQVDFLGVKSRMTSPEMTVLMKFFLGRFGMDNWGVPKDDYEDGWGTFLKQGINRHSLRVRAHKMGILEEVDLAEQIAKQVLNINVEPTVFSRLR